MLDDNKITSFRLDLQKNEITDVKTSTQQSWYSSLNTHAAVANKWDYFLFGITAALKVEADTVTFAKSIGFIMNMTKNRVTTLTTDGSPIAATVSTNTFTELSAIYTA